jgi:hypothetical protein
VPLKATCIDDSRTVHLIVGINRKDLDDLLAGGYLRLDVGVPLTRESEICVIFRETDADLVKALPEPVEPEGRPS